MATKTLALMLGIFFTLTTLPAVGKQLDTLGYSTEPIISKAIFDAADVAVRTVHLNNWLNKNVDTLEGEKKKQIREHLYYLINSHLKHRYANQESITPSNDDLILSTLFSWTERLGVFGGHLIYNHIKMTDWDAEEPKNILPENWSLTLNDGLFKLSSKSEDWEIFYPYYFMLADVRSFVNTVEQQTGIITISTGSAHHADSQGYSQATLMFIYSLNTEHQDFVKYWLEALSIPQKTTKPIDSTRGAKNFYTFDKSSRLHKEFISWQEKQGSFAIVYLGIDGTYQHNRQHFLDFLKMTKTHN